MLQYADKERLEAKVKEATYANMLGRMVLEATPISLRNKLLGEMNIREDEFVISAGAIIAEIIPYDEFVTRVDALKNRIEEDEEPADLDNPDGEKMTDADATDVLYVCGLIKEGVEMNINKMYSEVMALPDSVTSLDQLNIKNEVPDAIKNILNKDNITNFTADVMRAITTDIKNDIAIKQADEQAETDMITKVSEIEGDNDDLSDEPIPPLSGDIDNPDTPANTTEDTPADGGALDVPSSDIDINEDMTPIDISGEEGASDDENGDTPPATEEVIEDGEAPTDGESTEDEMTPIDVNEEDSGDAEESNSDDVTIDDSVDISDDDGEESADTEEGSSEDEEEFTIGKDAGANDEEDSDSMTPIDTGDADTEASTAEEHLDDLDAIHQDIQESADDAKEDEALIQESMIRKRVAYIPALQNLAIKLFKEDLSHTRKSKEGYLLGESNVFTQMEKMFAEAAEKINTGARTNPLTEGEYKKLLYNKVRNLDSYYDTVKTEYKRFLTLYNGDEKKAEEAFKKSKKSESEMLWKITYDIAILMLIGYALGFGSIVIATAFPAVSFGVILGAQVMSTTAFVTTVIHGLTQIGIYQTRENTAKSDFDTAMDVIKYSKDLSDAEKAKVEAYAKVEFEKYNNLSTAQKLHGVDITETGFFSRLASTFS